LKTSISLDDEILKNIDNFRRKQDKIPTLSKAVIDLIKRGLEVNTEIPKYLLTFENLSIHIREPDSGRGGSAVINLPYSQVTEANLRNEDKIKIGIKLI
jgi:hypothetical protein